MHSKKLTLLPTSEQHVERTGHRAKALLNVKIDRAEFNPADPVDVAIYSVFKKTGRWTKHFKIEPPSKNVVETIERKIMAHVFDSVKEHEEKIMKTLGEQANTA